MSDVSDAVGIVGGISGSSVALKYLWDKFVRREEASEKQVASDITEMKKDVGDMKSDVRLMVDNMANQKGALGEVKERVNKGLDAQRSDIDDLKERVTRLETVNAMGQMLSKGRGSKR